jgi:predicted 2-oxoglutarate/Fe(II)-dependent dioxygenase YbiX
MISSFFTFSNILTTTECQEIIDYCTDKCKLSVLEDKKIDSVEGIRHSINTFIQPEDINQLPVIKKLTDCVFKFSSQYFNFPIRYIEPVQYAEYTEGMYYTPHMDSGVTFECDRDISASVFLSPRNEYEGGNLSLMYPTGWEEADEQQGSMVLFPSMLTHKVEKVKKGKRSSLVLWSRR